MIKEFVGTTVLSGVRLARQLFGASQPRLFLMVDSCERYAFEASKTLFKFNNSDLGYFPKKNLKTAF